jgi:hypothetical protein
MSWVIAGDWLAVLGLLFLTTGKGFRFPYLLASWSAAAASRGGFRC